MVNMDFSHRQGKLLQGDWLGRAGAFADAVKAIHLQSRHGLEGPAARPSNFNALDFCGVTDSDFLPERIASEASTGRNGAVNRSRASRLACYRDLQSRADGRTVCFHTN